MSQVNGSQVSQGSIQRELQEGINAMIGLEYNNWTEEFSKILTVSDSKKAYEEDVMRSPTGLAPIKAEGSAITYDSSSEFGLQRYVHINYGLGVIITEEAMDDNLYLNESSNAGKMLGKSIRITEEKVSAGLFNNGYTTTNFTTWDGLALFSSAHKLGKGGTYSNILATPADLNEASLEEVLIAIAGYVDDAGLEIQAKGQTLFIPRQLLFIAKRILGSPLQNDTANNAINAIRDTGALPGGYEVNHYFTDSQNWLVRSDIDNGGKFFKRSRRDGMDNDFGTSNYRHKHTCRFSVGVSDPRAYFGSGDVPD